MEVWFQRKGALTRLQVITSPLVLPRARSERMDVRQHAISTQTVSNTFHLNAVFYVRLQCNFIKSRILS